MVHHCITSSSVLHLLTAFRTASCHLYLEVPPKCWDHPIPGDQESPQSNDIHLARGSVGVILAVAASCLLIATSSSVWESPPWLLQKIWEKQPPHNLKWPDWIVGGFPALGVCSLAHTPRRPLSNTTAPKSPIQQLSKAEALRTLRRDQTPVELRNCVLIVLTCEFVRLLCPI